MAKRLVITRGAMLGIVIAYILIVAAFWGVWSIQRGQKGLISKNQRAIRYICSTTTVLDALSVAQEQQIAENFANGTYEKLLRLGVLTPANIDAAHKSYREYGKAHQKLSHNGACRTGP